MANATPLILGTDINGNSTFQLPFSNNKVRVTLAASTAQSTVVPVGYDTAIFSYSTGANVWVDPTTTATLPSGSFAATTAELNPVARNVVAGQTLSFISSAVADVGVNFYQLVRQS